MQQYWSMPFWRSQAPLANVEDMMNTDRITSKASHIVPQSYQRSIAFKLSYSTYPQNPWHPRPLELLTNRHTPAVPASLLGTNSTNKHTALICVGHQCDIKQHAFNFGFCSPLKTVISKIDLRLPLVCLSLIFRRVKKQMTSWPCSQQTRSSQRARLNSPLFLRHIETAREGEYESKGN